MLQLLHTSTHFGQKKGKVACGIEWNLFIVNRNNLNIFYFWKALANLSYGTLKLLSYVCSPLQCSVDGHQGAV